MEEIQSDQSPEIIPVNISQQESEIRTNRFLNFLSWNWKQLAILIACTSLIYSITLTYDFVNYDDYYLVYQNESFLKDPANIFSSFSTSAFTSWRQESIYYRPILLVSYILDYQIWKLNPAGYHFTNIILHLFSAIFVYSLFNSLTRERWFALLGALIFSLHPINVESVAWIAGRNDILLGLFIITMIYLYHLHYERTEKAKQYFGLSTLAFVFALFTKESAAFYISLIPIYELTVRKEKITAHFLKEKFKKFIWFFIPLAAYICIRIMLFGKVIGVEEIYDRLPLIGRIQLAPAILMENLKLLIVPLNLSIEHPLDQIIWTELPWNWISLITSIALIAVLIKAIRVKNSYSFALFWIAIGLFPTLNIIPVAVPILEHRLYTPMIGFAFVLASIGLSINLNTKRHFGKLLLSAVIVVFAFSSFVRIPVWKNSESLWLNAIEKAPSSRRPYFNLAGYYFDLHEYDKSISLLKKYIELAPDDFTGYSKLRQTYYISGKIPEAISVCRQLIELEPKNENRYIELAALFEQLNQPDSAISIYQSALHRDSTFYRIHERVGLIFANLNQHKLAEQSFLNSIRINNNYGSSYFNLGKLYAVLGKTDSALMMIERGERISKIPTEVLQLREYLLSLKQNQK
jgi:protein O-mannosyl-transferase